MNQRSIVFASTVFVGTMLLTTAQAQSNMVCGLEILPSPTGIPASEPPPEPPPNPSGDPCLDGESIFGPARFERSNGKPELVMEGFELAADSNICIKAEASAKGKSFLYLDGLRIADPEEFDDGSVQQVHSLTAGSHGIGVQTVGKPGEHVDVEILQLVATNGGGGDPGLPAPGEIQIDPDTGALDMVSADNTVRLQNVASDHPLLTPNDDGDNDVTVFQALTTPLIPLPGKDDGTVDYFLDWQFEVTNLDTCVAINTGLSGMEQINSPTLVSVEWDATDTLGTSLPDGTYAYNFAVSIVSELGGNLGSIASPGFGLVIDGDTVAADYNERPEQLGPCNPSTDASGCKCPGVDGAPGVVDPTCRFAFVTDLLPELGLPPGTMPSYEDPAPVDKSFITTILDASTGRHTVTVDVREYNAGGLVPKTRIIWPDEHALRQWVSDMTGVPVGTGDSLFNFDYVQLGTTTGVDRTGNTSATFNHFFLDAITDSGGKIRIATHPTNQHLDLFNDDATAPSQFAVPTARVGDECSNSGNTNGVNGMRSKLCAYNTAFRVGDPTMGATDLGVYGLRTTVFDIEYNNKPSEQDNVCFINGIFTCGVRTYRVTADTIEVEHEFYVETAAEPGLTRLETAHTTDAIGLSFTADRGDGEDGVCSNAVATRDGLAVRMDAADGAVPDSCIINGIF